MLGSIIQIGLYQEELRTAALEIDYSLRAQLGTVETYVIGADSSILAHVEEGSSYTDGNVELRANDVVEETWELVSIDGFNWRQSEAGIDIGMGAQITGADIIIDSKAEASKTLRDIDDEHGDPELAFATRDVVLGDINNDG